MMRDTSYPEVPGNRGVDTSVAATADIQAQLGNLQSQVHEAIKAAGVHGLTTNEIAARLNVDRGSVQPRTSELKARGLIRDSQMRRPNANGKKAIVWVAGGDAWPR